MTTAAATTTELTAYETAPPCTKRTSSTRWPTAATITLSSVLNTAFDAVNAGYTTVVVSDCCSSAEQAIHDVAVHTIEVIGFSTTAADAVDALKAHR